MKCLQKIAFLRLFIITILFSACGRISKIEKVWTKETALIPSLSAPPLNGDISITALDKAIQSSISYYSKHPGGSLQFGNDTVSLDSLRRSLDDLHVFLRSSPTSGSLASYITAHFKIYKSGAESVLFTGYYTPLLHGSMLQTDRYKFPLYKRPSDLVSIQLQESLKQKLPSTVPVINRGRLTKNIVTIPYYSRKEIDAEQKLKDQNLELVWVDDPIDLFFLHIQGSGVVVLESGERWNVGYDDKNGHPYVAIGKTLADMQLLPKDNITMFSIKDALKKNPSKIQEVLFSNPSYCFFKKLSSPPLGSLSEPVTPEYSIATDSTLFPPGALVIIDTQYPTFDASGNIAGTNSITHLALNQDTGGAIRGAGRADIFFGDGALAEKRAGVMQEKGQLYFLAPK